MKLDPYKVFEDNQDCIRRAVYSVTKRAEEYEEYGLPVWRAILRMCEKFEGETVRSIESCVYRAVVWEVKTYRRGYARYRKRLKDAGVVSLNEPLSDGGSRSVPDVNAETAEAKLDTHVAVEAAMDPSRYHVERSFETLVLLSEGKSIASIRDSLGVTNHRAQTLVKYVRQNVRLTLEELGYDEWLP